MATTTNSQGTTGVGDAPPPTGAVAAAAAAAPTGAPTGSTPQAPGFFIPMSAMVAIIGAMQAMSQFAIKMTDSMADNNQKLAEVYMGQTTNADGTTSLDIKKGLLYIMQQATIDAGKADAQGLREQASGEYGAMASNAVGVVGTGVNTGIAAYRQNSIQTQMKNLQTVRGELESARAESIGMKGHDGYEADSDEAPQGLTDVISKRIDELKQGGAHLVAKPEDKDVLAYLKTDVEGARDSVKIINKRIDEQMTAYQSQLDKINTQAQMGNTVVGQLAQVGANASQATATMKQADQKENAAIDQAAASVLQQVQQTMSSAIDAFKTQAQQAAQQAQDTAAAMAQVSQARV